MVVIPGVRSVCVKQVWACLSSMTPCEDDIPAQVAADAQVEADEAAAAKCLGVSPYWLKIELNATSGKRSIEVNLKLYFKFHNMNIRNFKVQ